MVYWRKLVMKPTIQKIASTIAFTILIAISLPTSFAKAVETDGAVEAMSFTTAYGYGGGCTIPVTPPKGGFTISASPIYRNWWEWWVSPKVQLTINGGDAYSMKVTNTSNTYGISKIPYTKSMKWEVYEPWHQGWKKVYVKFYSSCGSPSSQIYTGYYYWGW